MYDEVSMLKVGRSDINANWDGTPAVMIITTSAKTLSFDKATERIALAEDEHEILAKWCKATRNFSN